MRPGSEILAQKRKSEFGFLVPKFGFSIPTSKGIARGPRVSRSDMRALFRSLAFILFFDGV